MAGYSPFFSRLDAVRMGHCVQRRTAKARGWAKLHAGIAVIVGMHRFQTPSTELDMLAPAIPGDESAQIHASRSLDVADTVRDGRFHALTRLARRQCGAVAALITLMDAEGRCLKSYDGPGLAQT